MEDVQIPIKLWMGIVTGWRPRNIAISQTSFSLQPVKTKNLSSSSNCKTISLDNAYITNLTTPLEFCINVQGEKYDIRTKSEADKETIVLHLQRIIKNLSSTKAFSSDYEAYKDAIDHQKVNIKNTFDTIILSMTFFQNLFHEMNQKLTTFDELLNRTKMKKNHDEFYGILHSLSFIREEMKRQFDVIIEKVYAYHDEKEPPEKAFKNGYKALDMVSDVINTVKENKRKILEEKIITGCIELDEDDDYDKSKSGIDDENGKKRSVVLKIEGCDSSNNEPSNPFKISSGRDTLNQSGMDDTEEEGDYEDDSDENGNNSNNNTMITNSSSITTAINNNHGNTKRKPSNSKKDKVIIDYSNNPSLYQSDNYDKESLRLCLPENIQCSKNMKSDMMKSLTAKKVVLPIYFNEPISMLQKQCEKFYYCDLLKKAAKQPSSELQLCYICAFITGEVSFNTSRFLKPFNPILGETFEYVDNEREYRFFAEQVSHDPPITAFIGEGESFAVYGDTKGKTSMKLLKGLEFEFDKKVHIILKKTKDIFIYNRPSLILKGLMMPPMKYDHCGTVTVSKADCPTIKATMTFIEESKKNPLGSIEGHIMNNGKITYTFQANWTTGFSYSDADGKNKVDLLHIDDQEFMHNTTESYKLPKYTCDLNALPIELKDCLPKGDSRFRPDMRAYESGKIEEAQELRKKVEGKQSLRHVKFNEDKVKHEPMYFNQSGEYVYSYNGGYWEDKMNKTFKHNNIFDIDD